MKRVFRAPIFKHTQETNGVIAMRKTMSLVLVLLTPLFVSATTTTSVPVVNSVTVSYSSNEVTVNGSGFLPTNAAPAVLFNNTSLALVSATDATIVAYLPSGVTAGTFNLTVTNQREQKIQVRGYLWRNWSTGTGGSERRTGRTRTPGTFGPGWANGTSGPEWSLVVHRNQYAL